MEKVGRNDPCPCGSGKKYKKCHMDREQELLNDIEELDDDEMGRRITALDRVDYGRTTEFVQRIDFKGLTGKNAEVRFVDFRDYLGVGFNPTPGPEKGSSAGMIVNPLKTQNHDPGAVYIAVTPEVNDSTLIHELAHVLEYLETGMLPGSHHDLGTRTGIPGEHLDHTMEFARWLDYLRDLFKVKLDAEDTVVMFLKERDMLLTEVEIKERNEARLTHRSMKIMRYLQDHRDELMPLIRELEGFIGEGSPQTRNE